MRDQFFATEGFDGMDELASGVQPGSDGLLFHPYMQGERAPYWDTKLRADFLGLTMHHGRAHFARALYEGVAYAIRDAMTAAEMLGLHYDTLRIIGGGSRSATWRQIVADVLGKKVLVPTNGDASFGAAALAGIGVGLFDDPADAVARCCHLVGARDPSPETHDRYSDFFGVYSDAQRQLVAINHRLHDLTVA